MKKILCTLLAALGAVCFCLALGGCTEKEPVRITNPIRESTLEELAEELGCTFSLDKVEISAPEVLRYNTDPVLYELRFTAADGSECRLRLQKNASEEDISGMHYLWTNTFDGTDPAFSLKYNDDGQGICLWQTGDINCCITMQQNAGRNTLHSMFRTFYAVMRVAE